MANEKRLIDGNALRRKALADIYSGEMFIYLEDLDDADTVDAVEAVRCKDCDFCHYNSCNDTYRCSTHNGMNRTVKPDEFCSYGERRPDNG